MNVTRPLPLDLAFSGAEMQFSKNGLGVLFKGLPDGIEGPENDSNVWSLGFDVEARTSQELLDGIKQFGPRTRAQFTNLDGNDEGHLTYQFSEGTLRDARIVTDEASLDDKASVVPEEFKLRFRDHQLDLTFSSVDGAMVRSGFLMVVPDDVLANATEVPAALGFQPAMRTLLAHVLGVAPETIALQPAFGGAVLASHDRGILSGLVLSAERRPGGKKVLALRFQSKDGLPFTATGRIHSLFSDLSRRKDELPKFFRARESGIV